MPPFGIRPGQVIALVRETRALSSQPSHLALAGPGAEELAATLAAGGDRSAVLVDGDPTRAAVAVRIVEGEVTPAERATLRRLARLSKPIVVIRHGGAGVPYAFPADVLDTDDGLSLEALGTAIARAAPDAAAGLAARLPALRPAVQSRMIGVTSWGNALIALSPGRNGSHLPLLSLAQGRLLLLLGASRGEALPDDPQAMARAVAPPIAACFAVGLASRELLRRLPVRGPLVRGGVAYAVTRALGTGRLRLP